MTKTPEDAADAPRVLLPGIAVFFFIAGPILIIVGSILYGGSDRLAVDADVDLILIGAAMFWIGVAGLVIALALEGVRAIAQQQVSILLKSRD